jgi:two-component system sensor histidine kinase KdpD
VSTVSHEFRTPLTCILGFARTLAEHGEEVPPELRGDFVARIVGHGERLHRLVENLLVASQVVEPDRNAVAEVRSQLLTVTTEMDKVGHHIETTIERGELRVRMGQDSLYHVLYNLIENGVKFSRHGTFPRVAVWRDGETVVIEVANQGPPIALADQVRIFDAFVQVDGSSTRAADGLGMGLAVVRTLVEAHGGQVGVRSDAGETVFWMRLATAARTVRRYAPRSCTQPPADSTWSNSSTATG